jgi:hypothetical protein
LLIFVKSVVISSFFVLKLECCSCKLNINILNLLCCSYNCALLSVVISVTYSLASFKSVSILAEFFISNSF